LTHYEHDIAGQIRQRGYRMTPQRQLILDALCERGEHLTAHAVYEAVRPQTPAINRATIYRVLQFLCALQLVTRTEIAGQAVYELVTETPHHHLVCRVCGQVRELPDRYFQPLAQQLLADLAFKSELNHLAISGVCARCQAA